MSINSKPLNELAQRAQLKRVYTFVYNADDKIIYLSSIIVNDSVKVQWNIILVRAFTLSVLFSLGAFTRIKSTIVDPCLIGSAKYRNTIE